MAGCSNTSDQYSGNSLAETAERITWTGIAPREEALTVLTIGTADSGGTMYPVGKAIAHVIGDNYEQIKVNVSASNGSEANVKALADGEIDLGLVSANVAYDATRGEGDFVGNSYPDLRAIGAVYSSLSNWMALKDSGMVWVHELEGTHLAIGPQDSATEKVAIDVLNKMEIDSTACDLENLGLGSGAQEVLEGRADAVHAFAGIPIVGLLEFSDQADTIVLHYREDEVQKIVENSPYYYPDIIPAGTYRGQLDDVPTFGVKCLLCVRADMDDELVYKITSVLYHETENLENEHPAFTAMEQNGFVYEHIPIELHEGAKQFYRCLDAVK